MTNIVGKIMLTDMPRGCQDEYAAICRMAQTGAKSPVFTGIFGKERWLTLHVNLNRGGTAASAGSVKREKATPV
jgi:hypothetical protein